MNGNGTAAVSAEQPGMFVSDFHQTMQNVQLPMIAQIIEKVGGYLLLWQISIVPAETVPRRLLRNSAG